MVNSEKPELVVAILQAAKKRLVAFGLDKTTMNEIADDIGMSKASLYYYFTNKEDLFRAVIQNEHEHFIKQQTDQLTVELNSNELLLDYAEKRLKFFQDFLNLNKLSLHTINKSKPAFAQLFEDFRQQEVVVIQKILEMGIACGAFCRMETYQSADLFVSLMQGLRRNIIVKKDILNITQEDYQKLHGQYISLVELFCKAIKEPS